MGIAVSLLPVGDIFGTLEGGFSPAAGPSRADAVGGYGSIGPNSVTYRPPLLDLGNPAHVAAAAGLLLLGAVLWRRMRRS